MENIKGTSQEDLAFHKNLSCTNISREEPS